MIPKKYDAHEYDYPDFQPDQVLSADHLNHSFAFNEQQERLTRTNLIGIGIVCGLKASKSADGKTVTISKGTGVTSHGYLIIQGKENSEESIDYKKYRSFAADIVKDVKYDVLVSGAAAKYPLWELLDANEAKPADPDLTDAFLSNKVLLLFYEMLAVDAKNCDTTSCDDKGKTISITVRKLLVNVTDADKIILELNTKAQASGSGEVFPGIYNLAEIKLPRFDVLATSLETTNDLFKAYQKIFTKTFVESVGNALNAAYNMFKAYLKDNSNPFVSFNTNFAFLHNGSIDGNDLLHFQYYWDFFSDLIVAYNEWRSAALPLGAMCTPPEALFPRHLFLSYFGETEGIAKSKYRNYFIPSPVLSQQEQSYKEFKSLFQRVVRLIVNRNLPLPAVSGSATADANIRITPSLIGSQPLGWRAIPYYYKPNEASNKLVEVWNYAETKRGKQNLILSYKPTYNVGDDFVQNPLLYDLESYNFFRVEGHIGKSYGPVLASLKKLITENRLPVDLVALELSNDPSNTKVEDGCGITHIQAQFELLKNELICCLKKNIKFWGELVIQQNVAAEPGEANLIPGLNVFFREKGSFENVNKRSGGVVDKLKEVEAQYRGVNNKAADEVKKLMVSIDKEEKAAASEPSKVLLMRETISEFSEDSVAAKYLDLHKGGNKAVRDIPAPAAAATFGSATLSYYALLIIDEMEEILLLLNVQDALLLKLDKLAEHNEAIRKAYDELEKLLSSYLKIQKIIFTIKASVSESLHSKVDQIVALIPEILDKNNNTLVLILLNPTDTTNFTKLISDLQKATTNAAKQTVINAAYMKIDKDGMQVPAKKDITYVEDPILRDIYNQLKNRSCACGYESIKALQELLKKEIDVLKQFNLFSKFVKKHPGIQHKAGVPGGGTFIIAYHRKGTASAGQFDKGIKALADGVVVADFYLPYLCTSDCQPVNFNVVIPVPTVSFALDKLEYCSEDDVVEYPFKANPTGGELTTTAEQKDSIKNNGDGTFSFLPGKVVIPAGAKDVTVTYTYKFGDQMQTLNVKVYAYPKVNVIATPDPNNPLKIDFTFDKPEIVSVANWAFGDAAAGAGVALSHTYPKGGEYTVLCEVKNGICSFNPVNTVVNPKDPEPVEIGLKISEICHDASAVSFEVSPKGGSFTGEGFTESPSASGKFKFTPSSVALNSAAQKIVTLTYVPVAGAAKTASVTVYEKPDAVANFGVIHGGTTVAAFVFSNLKNGASLEIDFGDGSSKGIFNVQGLTSFTSPSHLFPAAGTYKVLALLRNGTCSFEFKPFEITFEQVEEVVKVCQPLSIPVNDFRKMSRELQSSRPFIELYSAVRVNLVVNFFSKLTQQLSQSPEVPISFFAQNPLDPDWVNALPVNNETVRALSIRLLAILSDVSTTISCLKEEDAEDGNVSTSKFLQAVAEKILQLQKLTDNDKPLTDTLVADVNDEIKRLDSNQEAEKKKLFAELLKRILEAIKKVS